MLIIHGMHSAESRQKRMDAHGGPSLFSRRCLISTFKYSLREEEEFSSSFFFGVLWLCGYLIFYFYESTGYLWPVNGDGIESLVCISIAHKVLKVAQRKPDGHGGASRI